jgi:PAS domain S-box-containing protein
MRFDWLGEWGMIYFEWPERRLGFVLLALYVLLFAVLFVQLALAYYRRRLDLKGTWPRRIAWLLLWLVIGAVLANVLVLEWPAVDLPREFGQNRDAIAFLAYAPIVLAAAQLGAAPAILVGMVAGWVGGAFGSGRLLQIFEMGILGMLSSVLLFQDYKGKLGAFWRQPLVAVPWAGVTVWMLSALSLLVYTEASLSTLSAVSVTTAIVMVNLPVVLIQSFVAGAILQAAYALWPRLRAVQKPQRVPPYARSISLRFLFFFLPASVILLFLVLYAVMVQALRTAVNQSIDQIDHVARNVSAELPFFNWTGQSLLNGLALDDDLQSPEYDTREASLERGIKTMPFFSQIMLIDIDDPDRIPRNIIPNPDQSQQGLTQLTVQERRLLELTLRDGAPQISPVHKNTVDTPLISFVVPVFNALASQEIEGALIGRAYVLENYQLQSMLNNLQPPGNAETNRGEGFLIDDSKRIVVHPDSDQILGTWEENLDPIAEHEPRTAQSRVYEDLNGPERTRQLVYTLSTEGVPWQIVVIRPYENVLSQATEISTPLMILFLVGGLVVSLSVPIFTARLTRPLQVLSQAASEIAEGHLDVEVHVAGDDEVGQLGRSFEQMRQRLQERMEESSLLLDISRQVSASIELRPSLMPILNGALQATGGLAARVVLVNQRGRPDESIASGAQPVQEAMRCLDKAVEAVVKSNREVIIEDLRLSPASPAELRDAGIRGLIGIPLRLRDRVTGVLWVGHEQPHLFGETELRFLNTLCGQAAVVAANAQLFEDVQEERGRLRAILASTNDVVLVADADGTVLLCNPAATRAYGILPSQVIGRPLDVAVADSVLRNLFVRPMEAESALVDEVQAPDGRTFSASVSALAGGGRVVTLRDITYLKELDQMKSDFVNTVSHDLRSPLTYMRGYTSMIPMAGSLNERQQGFIDRIVSGIEQMTELIDDLLDIGKIEAGVGIQIERCWLPGIVQAVVDDLGMRAVEGEIELVADLPRDLPPTLGDNTLIRQAIKNLVENAIKYTPGPGRVEVCLHAEPESLVVSVHDNGIGIAPEDQHRLFEKFYRIRRRDTVHIRGTGLGLAIVKSIAELHGGRVWVESTLDEGSVFYLALPLLPVPEGTEPQEDPVRAWGNADDRQ